MPCQCWFTQSIDDGEWSAAVAGCPVVVGSGDASRETHFACFTGGDVDRISRLTGSGVETVHGQRFVETIANDGVNLRSGGDTDQRRRNLERAAGRGDYIQLGWQRLSMIVSVEASYGREHATNGAQT